MVVADRRLVLLGFGRLLGRGGFPLFFLVLLLLLLLDPDFLLEGIAELVGGLLEFGQALAERPSEFGQFTRAEDDEGDHENDDQLRHSDGTKHSLLLSRTDPWAEGHYSPEVPGQEPRSRCAISKLSVTMTSMRRYRPLPAVVFAILVSALVGGLFGRSALATDDKIPDHYKAYSAALNAIESSYIDKVDSEALVTSSIRGMLATLDPHSSYFTPREYAQMRERQEGRYYGIGVSIVSV